MSKQMCIFLFGVILLAAFTHGVPLTNDLEDELDLDNEEVAEARSIPDASEDLDSDFVDQLEARDVSSEENTVARRKFSVLNQSVGGNFPNSISAQHRYQQEMLQAHNTYRARHCAPPLRLDENLNKRAQKHAQYLASINKMVHSKDNYIGENLYTHTSSATINGKVATTSWYNEIKQYNFKHGGFTMQTGHFTQLVWKDSKNLGVGIATSRRGKTYVVAQYSPSGNMPGKFQKNVLPAEC